MIKLEILVPKCWNFFRVSAIDWAQKYDIKLNGKIYITPIIYWEVVKILLALQQEKPEYKMLGDLLLSSAIIAYLGSFTSEFRNKIIE